MNPTKAVCCWCYYQELRFSFHLSWILTFIEKGTIIQIYFKDLILEQLHTIKYHFNSHKWPFIELFIFFVICCTVAWSDIHGVIFDYVEDTYFLILTQISNCTSLTSVFMRLCIDINCLMKPEILYWSTSSHWKVAHVMVTFFQCYSLLKTWSLHGFLWCRYVGKSCD